MLEKPVRKRWQQLRTDVPQDWTEFGRGYNEFRWILVMGRM